MFISSDNFHIINWFYGVVLFLIINLFCGVVLVSTMIFKMILVSFKTFWIICYQIFAIALPIICFYALSQ